MENLKKVVMFIIAVFVKVSVVWMFYRIITIIVMIGKKLVNAVRAKLLERKLRTIYQAQPKELPYNIENSI